MAFATSYIRGGVLTSHKATGTGADCGYAGSDTNLFSPKSPHKADSTTLEPWEQMIDNVLSAARLTTSRSHIPVLDRAIMTGQCALEVHPYKLRVRPAPPPRDSKYLVGTPEQSIHFSTKARQMFGIHVWE
jgi:hypothetical protein